MKRFFKFLLYLFLLLIIAFGVFFFWASSATLDKKDYNTLTDINVFKPSNKDSVFSIVTYNIGYLSGMTNNKPVEKPKELFDNNLQNVLFENGKINPDIIAFQEIDYQSSRSYFINQEERIANFGYNFRASAINWDKNYVPFPYWPFHMNFGKVVSGQSIISKYTLKDNQRIVLPRVADAAFYRNAFYLDRLAQVATVVLNGKEVILINVHLEAFDKPTRAAQFKEVITLFNSYKDKYPTILLGDFNSKARDKKASVQEIFAMEGVGNAAFNVENVQNTFDSKDPYKRIDYIFYTKNTIEYVSGKVLTEFGEASDHLPVFMKFRLK